MVARTMFPSPTGVLYISIGQIYITKTRQEFWFPSPTGVLYISIRPMPTG